MPEFDSEKTHSELIEERDYWKELAQRLTRTYKNLLTVVHQHQDDVAEVLHDLGSG